MVEWVNALATVGALGIAALALFRTSKRENSADLHTTIDDRIAAVLSDRAEDLDQRIDDRITIRLAADIAVIKNDLTTIRSALAVAAKHDAELVRSAVDATANAISASAREMLRLRPSGGSPS